MAGRIRDSDIAAVRDRVRIDEVVGEYVALRSAGAGAQKGLAAVLVAAGIAIASR